MYTKCRVLHSRDITACIVALPLLSCIYMPEFTVTAENGWDHSRFLKSGDCLCWDCEGLDQLSDMVQTELTEQGWCTSEIDLWAPDNLAFVGKSVKLFQWVASDCNGCN